MPDREADARRRQQDRIRRRTSRLDDIFAFTPGAGAVADSGPMYTRGEAEQRASTLLAPLRALPAIVLEASKPAGPGTSGLEKAVDVDPHLAAIILAAGNSGFFRRGGGRPSNLAQLIDRVGTAAFRNITFIATSYNLYQEPLAWYGYGPQGLWWHLVGTAIAAWKLGEVFGLNKIACELLFMGALLHDIGKPTIQGLVARGSAGAPGQPQGGPGGAAGGVPPFASGDGRFTVLEAEVRTVNMTHSELVPLILDIWGVEHGVFAVAEHHHAPQRAGGHAIQASVLQLADLLTNQAGLGLERPYGFSAPPVERAADKLKIPGPTCSAIGDELGWAVAEISTEIASVGG